jgi:hypothetical protein
MNDILENKEQNLAPIIDEEIEGSHTCGEEAEGIDSNIKTSDNASLDPPTSNDSEEINFGLDQNENISDHDIKQLMFLFAVNEDIPMHYKQLLGKIIKKETLSKQQKIFIFNSIGYCWAMLKENKELSKLDKILLVRKIYKKVFGKYDDY